MEQFGSQGLDREIIRRFAIIKYYSMTLLHIQQKLLGKSSLGLNDLNKICQDIGVICNETLVNVPGGLEGERPTPYENLLNEEFDRVALADERDWFYGSPIRDVVRRRHLED